MALMRLQKGPRRFDWSIGGCIGIYIENSKYLDIVLVVGWIGINIEKVKKKKSIEIINLKSRKDQNNQEKIYTKLKIMHLYLMCICKD